jgi:hypothetical protein
LEQNLEQIIDQITAIEPCYGASGGNATRIYTASGAVHTDQRRLLTVLKRIAAHYSYTLPALRKTYTELLSGSQSLPLPLTHSLVLVPLKMRAPRFEQDGATGYVNLYAVKAVTPLATADSSPHRCHLALKGGINLPVCYTEQGVNKRFKIAKQAADYFQFKHSVQTSSHAAMVMEGAVRDVLKNTRRKGRIKCELYINYEPDDDEDDQ